MKVLVLGVTGMLGQAVFRVFSSDTGHDTWGTLRSPSALRYFSETYHSHLITGVDVLDQDALATVLAKVRPDVVINCVGLIKQLADANDPLTALPINAMLPHRLARLCALAHARLIHVSTDCVFSGNKGGYLESDISDAEDLYGKSKYIGELHDEPHAITLRTSIIGHELGSSNALVDWFLSQQGCVKGFSKAIFSGLPTVELARVMKDYVLPHPQLRGLYHVAAAPVNKLDLLRMVANEYGHEIEIQPDDALVIDRSLNGERFREATGYIAASWPELIKSMHANR
ncbi:MULTISPECIES: SDR family oxidoreductase [Pseudomonas]|uniref:dTDP-4-dehydrorhamnose reductase family protein n=1 Tax=Pseudomonas TaxID=286 RepID=UPI0003738A10|nr:MULTISPECIES: SDR family oxidoreductase [Pseudomonas]PNV99885.1 SDR family NAD(P)-dependent oxidoreductase [Pseudomonas protegens]ROM23067.1 NAD(P)-dependent oxidoreductase [Pseudomonas protegens]ROM42620.1 NAD(P)-dependent oxidoreductase [Pseudomonas protegens]URN87513.1 MAG: SDR family oxidoreductase [Pseudomonas protegens]UVM10010.1 SDR family oxidoreductase [Pseudomonas protegens]